MKRRGWLDVFPDLSGQYRWRKVASNGRITESSGESFSSKYKAKDAAVASNPELADRVREWEPVEK